MTEAEKALMKARLRQECSCNELFAGLRIQKKDVKRVFAIVYDRKELEKGDAELIANALFYTWIKINQAEVEEIELGLTVEGNGDESG